MLRGRQNLISQQMPMLVLSVRDGAMHVPSDAYVGTIPE